MTDKRTKIAVVVVKPLPGERRKHSSLVLVERPWRSKWSRAVCMGQARKCKAGECIHVEYISRLNSRCRPSARHDSSPEAPLAARSRPVYANTGSTADTTVRMADAPGARGRLSESAKPNPELEV